jgi:16S rRNA (guanine527-N7)-methyltransferase
VIERLADAPRRTFLRGRVEDVVRADVSRETFEKLEAYAATLKEEAQRQNLVSRSTLDDLWERHILDSAQLARFEPRPGASWLDIGSGAGLPGIVIACLVEGPVTLLEPRRLRVEFLHKVSESLGLNIRVVATKAERAQGEYEVITARAVANLAQFLKISAHLSTRKTVWALPKGRGAEGELAEARRTWQGKFHVEQSVTDAESFIVVATGVRAKK